MAEGHRERLRQRLENEEIDNIPDYVVLEMMLTSVLARCDTHDLALRLLDRFGTIAGVIDAPKSELIKVQGMGEVAASHLKLLPKFYKKYELSKWNDKIIFNGTDSVGKYLLTKFIDCNVETVYVLCLDVNCRLIAAEKVYEGNINMVTLSANKIANCALKHNASRVIIAHNHLSGNALPSVEDRQTTDILRNSLLIMGISLDDHLIIAGGDYVSIAEDNMKVKYTEE